MPEDNESVVEHLPLEEIRVEEITSYPEPENWNIPDFETVPQLPPVLIESDGGISLVAHHTTLWLAKEKGNISLKCMVVRSAVHIALAHRTISNCIEEALLFEGLLKGNLVENRSRLAEMLGFSRARITQVFNLLKLPETIKIQLLLAENISEFQLRPLIRINDTSIQLSMFEKLMTDNLTGRQMAMFVSSGKAVQDTARVTEESTADLLEKVMYGKPEKKKITSVKQDEDKSKKEEIPDKIEYKEIEKSRMERTPEQELYRLKGVIRKLSSLRKQEWEDVILEMKSSEVDILFFRGISLMQRGLYDVAMDVLHEVTATHPENALAYFYLGKCSNLLGNLHAAENFLRAACDIIPTDPDFIVNLAIVLEKQKRQTEATAFYRKARKLRKTTFEKDSV